jgi:hypothetical protein
MKRHKACVGKLNVQIDERNSGFHEYQNSKNAKTGQRNGRVERKIAARLRGFVWSKERDQGARSNQPFETNTNH